MPAGKGVRGDKRSGVAPVEPAAEPDEGKAGDMGSTPRWDVSLLIQRKLCPQQEILSGQGGTQAQPESEEAYSIHYKREQHGRERHEAAQSV
jgi:hypothetical protein